MKNQENISSQEKQSIDNAERTHILELTDKDFKAAIITLSQKAKLST